MKRYQNPKQVITFVLISVSFYLATDLFVFGGYKYLRDGAAYSQTVHKSMPDENVLMESEILDYHYHAPGTPKPLTAYEKREQELMRALENKANLYHFPGSFEDPPQEMVSVPEDAPAYESWKSFSIPKPAVSSKPKIVVIIDDLGMNQSSTRATIDLPGPLVLAFLPYAPQLAQTTKLAKEQGHELLIHAPMEPLNPNLNPGPLALRSDMTRADFDLAIGKMLESFEGYVGINNHMGSKLTQDPEKMEWVMEALEKRGLMFVDSMTINSSIGFEHARAHRLSFAQRDIFLDHEASREFVLHSLSELENLARKKGVAVAIGHPKPETLKALAEWIPTLKEKGFELVPVSAIAHKGDGLAIQAKGESMAAKPEVFGPQMQAPTTSGERSLGEGPLPLPQ